MDSASLELTYRLMTLSESRTISAGCVGAHVTAVTPCVEGIGHGHIRRMQYHEAFQTIAPHWEESTVCNRPAPLAVHFCPADTGGLCLFIYSDSCTSIY